MNQKVILTTLMSVFLLAGCNGGGTGSTSTPTATAADKTMKYADFLQRVDPKSGAVLTTAQQALASVSEPNNYPLALGSVYYQTNGKVVMGSSCIDNLANLALDVAYVDPKAAVTFSKNLDSSSLKSQLGISGAITGNLGKFKGSIDGSYLNSSSSDDMSITYNFVAQLDAKATLKDSVNGVRATGQTEHIDQLKAKTQEEATSFYNACGDQYVSVVPAGAYVSTSVKLSFSSKSDKEQFNAAMSARVESLGAISAAVNAFNETTGKSEDVSVYALQVGGLPENLFRVFDSHGGTNDGSTAYQSYDLLTCSISNMEACNNLIAAIIHYTANDFISQIKLPGDKNYTNLAQFGDPADSRPYDNVVGYSNATSALSLVNFGNSSAIMAAGNMATMLDQDSYMLKYINNYLAADVRTPQLSAELAVIKQVYETRMNLYNTYSDQIAKVCFNGSANLDSNNACSKLKDMIVNYRKSTPGYTLSDEQNTLLNYLDTNGFMSGGNAAINKSTLGVLYPAGINGPESEIFGLSPMAGLGLLLDGFSTQVDAKIVNKQLSFSGTLSNGSKNIEITTPKACSNSSNTYKCSGVKFKFNGFSAEEQLQYTESLNALFNTQWTFGKNSYLSTGGKYK